MSTNVLHTTDPLHTIDPSQPSKAWRNLLLLLHRLTESTQLEARQSLFWKVAVVRSPQDCRATTVHLPSQCWVLNQEITNMLPLPFRFGTATILIRSEYLAAFEDLISFYLTGLRTWTTTSPQTQPQNAVLDIYPALSGIENPFTAEDLARPRTISSEGVSLTGQTGNGKSICLLLILILRLAARLPTIYVTFLYGADRMLFFNGDLGVSYISQAQFHTASEDGVYTNSTWILFDSDLHLSAESAPHTVLLQSKLFTVQAVSPGQSHLGWASQPHVYWTMAP